MAFKKNKKTTTVPDNPVALFNDLHLRTIPGMLSHQADVSRSYVQEAVDVSDVALQLPTGSGKTLVGLMIGEWRRRKFEERILYLCPTNQLVHQVANEAKSKYGLNVNAFTGSNKEFNETAKREYQSSEAIAITSYSGLFNTSPYFSNPQVIILDDAHAAENYIASFWTVRVENIKPKHRSLYSALISVLKNAVSHHDYSKMAGNWNSIRDKGWIDKIATPIFYSIIPEIINVFDTYVKELDLRFPWSMLRDHLHACHL
jgi:Type III restriction enzyme, res subunit